LKVLSYNIRNALMPETQARHEWSSRRQALAELIGKFDPDILALQEDSEEQRRFLETALAGSHRIFCDPDFYDADSAYNALFVRDGIEVRESGSFWISPDEGSVERLEGSICRRHATWLRARVREQDILIANVHLDHAAEPAFKRREAKLLQDCIEDVLRRSPGMAVMLGDFNFTPDSEPYRLLGESGWRDAARLRGDEQATFFGWDNRTAERIDYCWLSAPLGERLIDYIVLREPAGERESPQPSDHCPVGVTFAF
jgi:endonuclease/exonuclease/phosphatase family metal-dependent hydrolase